MADIVDLPATPDDLLLADWLLWATPADALGVRRYYCRQLTTQRKIEVNGTKTRRAYIWLNPTGGEK